MYFVCQINRNVLGSMTQFDTLEEAQTRMSEILTENGITELDASEQEELDNNYSYANDEWGVSIGIVG